MGVKLIKSPFLRSYAIWKCGNQAICSQQFKESKQTTFLEVTPMRGQHGCLLKMGVPGHHLTMVSESWWPSPKIFSVLIPGEFMVTKTRKK